MSKRKSLPFPRLELRWTKLSDNQFQCNYQIVISAPDKGDIRSNDEETCEYGVHNIEGSLNEIIRNGSAPDHWTAQNKKLDMPFRDGVHIMRDSKVLNLPGFVTYKGQACEVTADADGRVQVGNVFRYKKGM